MEVSTGAGQVQFFESKEGFIRRSASELDSWDHLVVVSKVTVDEAMKAGERIQRVGEQPSIF